MITKQEFDELFNNRQFNISMIDEEEFLETIEHLYSTKGMTQKEIADYVNCGMATICRYLQKCNVRTERTKTHEQFVTELSEVNPDLKPLEKYTKSYHHILIKCLVCDYEFLSTPDNLLQGVGCPKCGKKDWQQQVRKSHAEFMAELKEKNDHDLEVLEEYQWRRKKILVRCSECNHQWRVSPNNLLKGHGCPECKWDRIRRTQMKSHQQFLAELYAITDQFTPLEEYNGIDTPILIKCHECDNQWQVAPAHLLKGGGCPECARLRQTKTHEQFLKELYEITDKYKPLEKYQTAHTKILVKCKACKHEWRVAPKKLLAGRGCPVCTNSKGEEKIRYWLKQNDIDYILQYTDKSCKYVEPLRFDFYLPNQQIMIEYDGIIHFKPVNYFGGKQEFEQRRIRDKIKNDWCQENNYLLIRISNLDIIQERLDKLLIDQQLENVNQIEEYWNQELDFCIITAR